MLQFPLLLTLYAGFSHAFETDHLLAVSNIVTRRSQTLKAVKDGLYWGMGHTSTLLLMGVLMLLLKFQLAEKYFGYFEAGVGLMLVLLGIFRLARWFREKKPVLHIHRHAHNNGPAHAHLHWHTNGKQIHQHTHWPAYNIGLVHGLAGSGSLILLVMSQSQSVLNGLAYLLIFGLGSVMGMMLAAGAFSLPFSRKLLRTNWLMAVLVWLSASLCIVYGGWVIYENLN